MNIAVVSMGHSGKFFDELMERDRLSLSTVDPGKIQDHSLTDPVVRNFLSSFANDLEKVVLAKGITVSGVYKNLDEMTFSQKERASLVLVPEIYLDKQDAGSVLGGTETSTISGKITFTFYEPMSKEKVWVKKFDIPTVSHPVKMDLLRTKDGGYAKDSRGLLAEVSRNSVVDILNSMYPQLLEKVSSMLDAREILKLKIDADKLKSRTRYNG